MSRHRATARQAVVESEAFLVLPHHHFERAARGDARLVQRRYHLDRAERTQVAIEVAAVGDGIDVRAEEHRGQGILRPCPPSEDVAGSVDARLQPGAFHQLHHVGASGDVGIGVCDAAHAVGKGPAGWPPEDAEFFEVLAKPRGIHARPGRLAERTHRERPEEVAPVHLRGVPKVHFESSRCT